MIIPDYHGAALSRVLPSVATSLGIPGLRLEGDRQLAPVRRAVVVLVDGLGWELLNRRSGHAPWLRAQLATQRDNARASASFPTTTATSMGTFGVGEAPGVHGLVGYDVLWPAADRVFNELNWEDGPPPAQWQPHATVLEEAERAGIAVTRIGPGFFDGSGLTQAAQRGGRFVAAQSLEARVKAAITAAHASPRALVYLYWGEVDKVGHVHGCDSWAWGDELTAVDDALARLAQALPADTALHVTADHGMVDIGHLNRIDLAEDRELDAGVRHVAGEPRCLQLHTEPGAAADVLSTWRGRLGERAQILTREEAISMQLFGTVSDEVRPRIGDLLVLAQGDFAVEDSRIHRDDLRALIGLHGALSADEVYVPWIVAQAES